MRLGVARAGSENKVSIMAEERTTPAVNSLMPPPSSSPLFSPTTGGSVPQDQTAMGAAAAAQESEATIEAAINDTADVRVEEAATPQTIKASDLRSEGAAYLNESVVSESFKGKGVVKGSVVVNKAGPGGGGGDDDEECSRGETGDETNTGGGLARLGRGKRPRDGESLRARKEEVVVEASVDKVLEASPDIDKLWANCARQLAPIRKCDEQRLVEMEHGILESWGIHPAAARELAEKYEGTWLNPTMGREELTAALSEMMPSVAKEPPLVALGRPYSDVWAEENFISNLEDDEADGSTPNFAVGTAAVPAAAASANGVPTGADGERRSRRACGRRSSAFGGGAGGGSGCVGGGSGASGGAGGDGKGSRRRGVVLPCLACRPPTSNFSKIVPTHDEARFRRSLAVDRRRLGLGSGVAFGTLKSGGCEGWGKERRSDKEEGEGVVGGKGFGDEKAGDMEDLPKMDQGIEGSSSSSVSRLPERPSRGEGHRSSFLSVVNAPSHCSGGNATARASAASDVTVNAKVNHKVSARVSAKVKTRESSRSTISRLSSSTVGVAGGRERRSCRPLVVPPPPPTKETLFAAVLSEASMPEAASRRIPDALAAAAKAVKGGDDAGVSGDGAAAEDTGAEVFGGSRHIGVSVGSGVSGARFAEPASSVEREKCVEKQQACCAGGTGLEGDMEEEDEICHTITEDWERLKKAELTALYHIVKLQGLSRQERCVFQSVTDRASDAQDLLSSALLLSLQSRPTVTERKIKVGLAADFPYHDPAEVPVIEARRQRNEAMQKAHWVHEDMAGCSLQELEEEKARREKRKKETTEVARKVEEAWKPQRLAAGRPEQKGRGCGLPVPGGVAHPFLVIRDAADFLYSLSLEQEVEAKDEWGAWCRGKVVAVRGDGGWVPERGDTNVLRAVKVSFEGWGDAMDAWLPVDSGTIAKPGTHLPVTWTAALTTAAAATAKHSSNQKPGIAAKQSAKPRKAATPVSGRNSRGKYSKVGGAGTNGILSSGATAAASGTSDHFECGTTTPGGGRSKTSENRRAGSKRTRTPSSAPSRGREEGVEGGPDDNGDNGGGASVGGASMRCSAWGVRRGGGGRGSGADKRATCDRAKRVRGRPGKGSNRVRLVNGGSGVVNGVAVLPGYSEGNNRSAAGKDRPQGGDEEASPESANGGSSAPSPGVVQRVKLRTDWAKAPAKSTPNGTALHPPKDLQAPSSSHSLPASDTLVGGAFVASTQRGKRNAFAQAAGGDVMAVGGEKNDNRRWANVGVVHRRDREDGSDKVGESRSSSDGTSAMANAISTVAARRAVVGLLPVSGASASSPIHSSPDDAVSSVITKTSSNEKSCSSFPAEERASSTSSPSPSSSSSSSTFGGASFAPASASSVMRAPPSQGEVAKGDGAPVPGVQMESAMDVELTQVTGQYVREPKGVLNAALQGFPLVEAYHGAASGVADGMGKEKELGSANEGSASASALATNVRANGHVGGAKGVLRRG